MQAMNDISFSRKVIGQDVNSSLDLDSQATVDENIGLDVTAHGGGLKFSHWLRAACRVEV